MGPPSPRRLLQPPRRACPTAPPGMQGMPLHEMPATLVVRLSKSLSPPRIWRHLGARRQPASRLADQKRGRLVAGEWPWRQLPVAVRRRAKGTTLLNVATEVALEQPDKQKGPEPTKQSARPHGYRGRQEEVECEEPEEDKHAGRRPGDPPHIRPLPEGARRDDPQSLRRVEQSWLV